MPRRVGTRMAARQGRLQRSKMHATNNPQFHFTAPAYKAAHKAPGAPAWLAEVWNCKQMILRITLMHLPTKAACRSNTGTRMVAK
eukprot:1157624-Pelagomonas_calceolata.AAC.3